jgi:nucleotide-binding universal stress UspA family protein
VKITSFEESIDAVVRVGNVSEEILRELNEGAYDYAVLGARKKRLLTELTGSVTYDVISRSPVPVITIKDTN